jgi:hypothetical protein
MQVIQHLLLVQLQRTAVKMQGHGGQATTVIGKGTLTFTGNFDVPLELSIKFVKFRY